MHKYNCEKLKTPLNALSYIYQIDLVSTILY